MSNFKVTLSGGRTKVIDVVKTAKKLSKYTKISQEQIIKYIEKKQQIILASSVEHKKAYQIKSLIEGFGLKVKLEPAKIYLKPIKQEINNADKIKNEPIAKLVLADSVKIKKPEALKATISKKKNRVNTLQTKSDLLSFNNILFAIIFLGALWYTYGSKVTPNTFDDNGNPVVQVFTIDRCGKVCDDVINDLNSRNVPFEQFNIDPNNTEDEHVQTWEKLKVNGFPMILSGNELLLGNSKAQMATLLALNYGEIYLTRKEKPLYKNHHNVDGSSAITIYGADWCRPCTKLKKQLKNDGIDFKYLDLDKNPNKASIMKTLEIQGYPAVWIGYRRSIGIKFDSVMSAYNENI